MVKPPANPPDSSSRYVTPSLLETSECRHTQIFSLSSQYGKEKTVIIAMAHLAHPEQNGVTVGIRADDKLQNRFWHIQKTLSCFTHCIISVATTFS
jgi:hypothetical protein